MATLILVTTAMVTGCASAPDSTHAQTTAEANSVNVGLLIEPAGLNIMTVSGAAIRQVELGNVYEGLVRLNHDATISPLLASAWDVSPDGLRYTFHLRTNATFSDGQPVTAYDAAASLNEACGKACAQASTPHSSPRLAAVQSVRAADRYTVVVTLRAPSFQLLSILGTDAGVIVPAHPRVNLNQESDGSGPYRISEWKQGSTLTLTRRADYWGTPAANARTVFHFYSDQIAASNALAAGDIDLFTAPGESTLAKFSDNPAYTLTDGPQDSWMILGFNNADPILRDARIRHAIRQGINKADLIRVLGVPADRVGSAVAPGDPWFADMATIDAYNPTAARKLLARAGHQQIDITLKVPNTYDAKMSEFIAAELSDIGIHVHIQRMEFAAWLAEVYTEKNYQMTIVLHAEPWTLENYGNPDYYWNYANPQAAALLEEAQSAPTVDAGARALRELAMLASRDAASDWLYSAKSNMIVSTRLSGFPTARTGSQLFVFGIRKSETAPSNPEPAPHTHNRAAGAAGVHGETGMRRDTSRY
ncbi:MAG: ABC transporter substrate-binding protein [Actinomycetaceae bacterium]|nr:ABC transporter substrate-binding protein [Actinomycetaceae bacterium]MDY6082897.1 ABC transporter substrate-binding protein [Actinomycetaceae bacterium]